MLALHESEGHTWEQTQCCFAEMNLEDERQDLSSVQYGVQTDDTVTYDVTELVSYRSVWLFSCVFFPDVHLHTVFSLGYVLLLSD